MAALRKNLLLDRCRRLSPIATTSLPEVSVLEIKGSFRDATSATRMTTKGAKLSSPCAESLHLGADASSACGGCAQRSLKKLQRALSTRYDVSEDRERWGARPTLLQNGILDLQHFPTERNPRKHFKSMKSGIKLRTKVCNSIRNRSDC